MNNILTNDKKTYILSGILFTIFIFSISDVFALEESDISASRIVTSGDLYIESKEPISVPFKVSAISSLNNPIPVECDKTPNSTFKVGKTTVRCMAIDSTGDILRKSFVVTVGYNVVQIPDWFKQTTEYWMIETISDNEYAKTLQFLIGEKIIHVPQTKIPKQAILSDVPVWVKTNAKNWINGDISNDEFAIGLDWILRNPSN